MIRKRRNVQPPREQQSPQSLRQVYLKMLLDSPPILRGIILVIVAVSFIAYIVWKEILPASVKDNLFIPAANGNAAPQASSNSSSNISTNINAAADRPSQRLSPVNQSKPNAPTRESQLITQEGNRSQVIIEIQARGLVEKLRQARSYAATGNIEGQEKALELYRLVLSQLSHNSRMQLDQGLLKNADKDYKDGHSDDALRKYRKLFAPYL